METNSIIAEIKRLSRHGRGTGSRCDNVFVVAGKLRCPVTGAVLVGAVNRHRAEVVRAVFNAEGAVDRPAKKSVDEESARLVPVLEMVELIND